MRYALSDGRKRWCAAVCILGMLAGVTGPSYGPPAERAWQRIQHDDDIEKTTASGATIDGGFAACVRPARPLAATMRQLQASNVGSRAYWSPIATGLDRMTNRVTGSVQNTANIFNVGLRGARDSLDAVARSGAVVADTAGQATGNLLRNAVDAPLSQQLLAPARAVARTAVVQSGLNVARQFLQHLLSI